MGEPSFRLPSEADLPSDAALESMLADLDQAINDMPDTQRELMSLSAVAWSEDGMVKAEVGPRGQLVDLEIDPRVFRHPDARALKESVLGAVTAAVREVTDQTHRLVFRHVSPELAELRAQFLPEGDNPVAQMLRTDAELMAERRRPG